MKSRTNIFFALSVNNQSQVRFICIRLNSKQLYRKSYYYVFNPLVLFHRASFRALAIRQNKTMIRVIHQILDLTILYL